MPPKPRSKSETKSSLLQALEFVSCVSEKLGAPHETHVGLKNNWAVAFNGIVAAGCPIQEDIYCFPHTIDLVTALSKCDENFSITQLENTISIKSGKFKAQVDCLDPRLMPEALPDPQIVEINNKFKEAVEAVGVLANEKAQHILAASVLMNGASVVATHNSTMLFEYWHGLDLPPNVPLPKEFVKALCSHKKNLTGFGFSNCSATFYFEDRSWLRTQLYATEWPDVSRILNIEGNLWSIDPNFFKALDAVTPFSEDGNVYFDNGLLMSDPDGAGATYECSGLPKGVIYPIKQLKMIQPYVKKVDWQANGVHTSSYCLKFEGDVCRGVISGRIR